MLDALAQAIATSALREQVLWALMNVPGLPPIAQGIHIIAIAAVCASALMITLRFLKLAVPSQSPSEMITRLTPWTWWALPVLLTTGALFVIARPDRYFYNPIALWKFGMLAVVLGFTSVLYFVNRYQRGFWEATPAKLWSARAIAFASLALWVAIIFAGRWIAYLDYLIY